MTNLNIIKALQAFQSECPSLVKETEGYGYKYVTLEQMLTTINPLLQKHGLFIHQQVHSEEPETFMLRTTLMHLETGEQLASNFKAPIMTEEKGMNRMQSLGSSISYLRRYMILSALNLATVDDDAATAVAPRREANNDSNPQGYFDQRHESQIREETNHTGGAEFPKRDENRPWLNKTNRGQAGITPEWSKAEEELSRGLITIEQLEYVYKINKENKKELLAVLIFPDTQDNQGGPQ